MRTDVLKQELTQAVQALQDEAALAELLAIARDMLADAASRDMDVPDFTEEDHAIIARKLAAGEADIKAGRVHTHAQVMAEMKARFPNAFRD